MKINKGDFIDSRQFSREECERFIKLAVECGYTDAEGMKYYGNTTGLDALGVASTHDGIHVPYKHIGWGNTKDSLYGFCNNISQQFREFLDKENSMKNAPKDATHYGITNRGTICFYKLDGNTWYFLYDTGAKQGLDWFKVKDNNPLHTPLIEINKRELGWFWAGYSYPSHTPSTEIKSQITKSDLLDGMRVTMRCGYEWYVCGKERMVALEEFEFDNYYANKFSWKRMTDTLEHDTDQRYDIVKVVDRDNTVVWDRQETPNKKKVTLELTDEQIAQVKAQFML